MALADESERIELAVQGGVVQLLLPDGDGTTTRCLPLDVVLRSTVLSQAISTIDGDEGVPITLPKGLLRTWLMCVDALDDSAARPGCEALASEPRILEYVQVADFLDDQASLQQLCQPASAWLFEPASQIAKGIVERNAKRRKRSSGSTCKSRALAQSENRFQALSELPENLIVAILRAAVKPLTEQLPALPQAFRSLAVHATYPEISNEGSLELNYAGMTPDAAEPLWQELMQLTSLRITGLDANSVSDGGQWLRVASISTLEILNLSKNKIGDAGVRALGCQPISLTSLLDLNLTSTNLGEEGAESLGPHFESLTSLTVLRLDENEIKDKGAAALAPHIAKLTSLLLLSLSQNDIKSEGAQALGPHIGQLASLNRLCLAHNFISAEGITSMAPHLANLHALQALELHDIDVHDAVAFEALGANLANVTTLTELTLDQNSLGTDGVKALGPHLAKLTALEMLGLGVTDIWSTTAECLGLHLACLPALQEVELCFNQLGCEGAEALSKHLCNLAGLQRLRLMCNFITGEGAKAMGPYLAKMPSLQLLDLNSNELGDVGATALGVHLASVTSLQSLYIAVNRVSAEVSQQVRTRLPGVEIVG